MCPCISSKNKYAVCWRFNDGLMVPSIFQRENHCFSLYELCPLFALDKKCGCSCVDEMDHELVGCGA